MAIVTRGAGVRWGLVAVGAVAASAGGFCLWDRWATARLAPPDPGRLAELNRPRTAADVAGDLAGHIASILALARLSAEDRDRLVDLEWRLHLRSRGRRLEASPDLGPYAGVGIADEVAVMEAERLLSGGPPWSDVAEWSPPSPADAAALAWFVGNLDRVVDADEEARRQEKLVAQASRWRRLRALSRR